MHSDLRTRWLRRAGGRLHGGSHGEGFSLDPTDLGILFSAGIAGMGFGALFIGPMGDKLGRRTTVLLCLGILCSGMLISSVTRNVTELATMRFYTGLGIGGVLANINIVVANTPPIGGATCRSR